MEEIYNYKEAMYEDIVTHVKENYTLAEIKNADREELAEKIYEACWIDDSVTGNASGSYFCNSYKAEEALCHNLDLLTEACEYFGSDIDILKSGAEACDVTIRCYLLGIIIEEVLDDIYSELDG